MNLKDFFETEYFRSCVYEALCYRALQNGGVDNWEYYGDSFYDYCVRDGAGSMEEMSERELEYLKKEYLND